jgi:hypothetical protein
VPLTFANESQFAAHLAKLVPDTKTSVTDAQFVQEAVRALNEDYPGWETVDVGDGTTKRWVLGTAPFTGYVLGYSDLYPIEVEQLDGAGNPYDPASLYVPAPKVVEEFTGGAPTKALRFETAPAASGKARVKFQKAWEIGASTTNIPAPLQLSIVHKAAAKKCRALASYARSTIDPMGGSELYDAQQRADGYESEADRWDKEYAKIVGVGGDEIGFTHGRVRTMRHGVFPL